MAGFIKCPICRKDLLIDEADPVYAKAEALHHLKKHLKRLKNPEKIKKVKRLIEYLENPVAPEG